MQLVVQRRNSLASHKQMQRFIRWFWLLAMLLPAPAAFASKIHIRATDQSNTALANVKIEFMSQGRVIRSAVTNHQGEAELEGLPNGTYDLVASKKGFITAVQKNVVNRDGSLEAVEFVLHETVTVQTEVSVSAGSIPPLEIPAGVELSHKEMRSMPGNPGSVSDVLPLVPGVIRSPNGQIQISGSSEHHSAFIVNSADTTDPMTGQFGATLPLDSIETMRVLITPYSAQYGRFTAGVVSIDTRGGGEKVNFEFNDPVPEFRIRSGRIVGLREFTPRLTLSGPVLKNRLYFAEAFTYDIEKHSVRTLSFPFNESKQQSFNSFAQMDYVASPTHTLLGSLHVAPAELRYANLDFFNPQPVTPNFYTQNYTATILDRMSFKSGLLQSTLASSKMQASVEAQAEGSMILTPTGNRGSYFNEQHRHAMRSDWSETFSLNPIHKAGVHNLQFGTTLEFSSGADSIKDQTIRILDNSNRLVRKIAFSTTSPVRVDGFQSSLYGQDHWIATSKLAFDAGARLEEQTLTGTLLAAPRAGVQFQPGKNRATVIRGGLGVFHDQVPFNVFSFERWPEEFITTYSGSSVNGPHRYHNRALASRKKRFSTVQVVASTMSFAPSSTAWNVEVEHRFAPWVVVRGGYFENKGNNFILLLPERIPNGNALVLRDTGQAWYRQLEVNSRLHWKQGELAFSYVHSLARGDLNEFDTFLGSFPVPTVPGNRFATLPTDIPNRFVVFGQLTLPKKCRLTPFVEYRNGFPYQARDVLQNFVEGPTARFPDYFSLDTRLAKDFQVTSKYTLTVAISGTNLTDHFNALAVHANTADTQFGKFFGSWDRRARLDFDVNF